MVNSIADSVLVTNGELLDESFFPGDDEWSIIGELLPLLTMIVDDGAETGGVGDDEIDGDDSTCDSLLLFNGTN